MFLYSVANSFQVTVNGFYSRSSAWAAVSSPQSWRSWQAMAQSGTSSNAPSLADTHLDPLTICPHLEWLAQHLPFPVHIVDNGRSPRGDVKAVTNQSGYRNCVDIPVYLKGGDRHGDGIGRRQCTEHYKIVPVRRKIRELLGLSRGQRVPRQITVELWLGMSTDEAIRMRFSRDRWMENRYPLVEAGMSRQDCLKWWAKYAAASSVPSPG